MAALIAGEFRKLLSTRLWLWLLLAALGVTALYATLDIAFANTPGTFTLPLTTPQGQRTLLAVGAGGSPLVAVLAAVGVTGEYRHRTVTMTFLATPHRGRVVVAKLAAYAMSGAAFALACFAAAATIALPWLATKHIPLTVGVSGVIASFPGRMDWSTNTVKPNDNSGWIVQVNNKVNAADMTLYVVCVNAN